MATSTAGLQAASAQEREAFWRETPAAERMQTWLTRMNAFLAPYITDPARQEERTFLQKILYADDQTPLCEVEVSADVLYRIFMQDGKGEVECFARRIVTTHTREEIERNQELIVQLAKMYGEQTSQQALALTYALKQPTVQPPYALLGTDVTTGREIALSQRDRLQGLFCIGSTGTGKTTLLHHLILSDIRRGLGVCLIEPHGDLTNSIIATIPDARRNDIIYLDLTDSQCTFGLNLFQCDTPHNATEVAKVASFVMHVFEKVWNVGTSTLQLAQVLRNMTRTLIETGLTFAEIPLLLWDDAVREQLINNVTNTQTKMFWQQYNRRSVRDRDELTSSTINKVDAYLNEPMIANIVSQERSTIDFRTIMDGAKILLIRMSPQLEEMSRLVGSILIGKLLMCAFSRSDTREEDRRQFNLYVDEFERFASSDFASFLAEARKFRVAITLANQTLEQLDEANRSAALSAGSLGVFRVSGTDAAVLAKNYDHTPPLEQVGVEPVRSPCTNVVEHLVRRGHSNPVVARFTAEYLMRLEALLKKLVGHSQYFGFGCVMMMHPNYVIDGQKLLNDALASCQREGRPDVFVHPHALFILGGAADADITQVFWPHLKKSILEAGVFIGLRDSANRFGRPEFRTEEALKTFLAAHTRSSLFGRMLHVAPTVPPSVAGFVRLLRSLSLTMGVLAREPIMVDTGQYTPILRPRPYSDVENQIANDLSQLPNFHAKVKLLSGEHTIQTHPTPQGITGEAIPTRISAIKDRMIALGYCRYAREVEKEVRDRHERLRQPREEPPPTRTRVRRPG